MFRNMMVSCIVVVLVIASGACAKKEDAPQSAGDVGARNGTPDVPNVNRTVVVPREVAAKWRAVKVAVGDKTTGSSREFVVPVGADFAVPNTEIRVKVLAFLPDLRMGEQDITSASDKPNNPAAQVEVREPGKADWRGWLYSLYPQIHPFPHEKFALTLVAGVSK